MSDFHPGSWNPAWSVATMYDVTQTHPTLFTGTDTMARRLTGLLSFMLSDEITTGGVSSSDSVKRQYAANSHQWNLGQPRFREAFSEVSIKFFGPRLLVRPGFPVLIVVYLLCSTAHRDYAIYPTWARRNEGNQTHPPLHHPHGKRPPHQNHRWKRPPQAELRRKKRRGE